MTSTTYLLDANVFIQAKNQHYGFDFCPGFWNWLILMNKSQKVFSIQKVAQEIDDGKDELSDWSKGEGKSLFLPPDNKTMDAFPDVSAWITSQEYTGAAIGTFMQKADYWIVAHAKGNNFTVVTHEVPGYSSNKIKIPNVCVGMDVKQITLYDLLRAERARLILAS